MRLNQDPAPPLGKPCMRDMHELLTHVLPEQLIKLTPLGELERRAHEIACEQPRFREELPLVLAGEHRRRQRLSGRLHLVASVPSPLLHA